MSIYDDEMESIKEKKKTVYKPPLPKKRQRVCHHKSGRPRKVKVFTDEEIFLYKLKQAAKALGRE